MQLKFFLSIALATLSTSLPTNPVQVETSKLSKRDTWVGYAYASNGSGAGDLIINGGCVHLGGTASSVRMQGGVRCRFYR